MNNNDQYQPLVGNNQGNLPPNQNNDIELGNLLNNNRQNSIQGIDVNGQLAREAQYKKQVDSIVGEMVYTAIIIITASLFVILNSKEQCHVPIKMWVGVSVGSYLMDFILQMSQFHNLKKYKKESLIIMGLRYLVLVFLVSWLIYGNVLNYKRLTESECKGGLRLMMSLLLILGYFEMMKCCCVSLCVCIMIPFLFFAIRRAQRPNWVPAPPQFVQNLYRTRFNPQQNQAFDQCAICLLDFAQDDEIVPLPCDEKHYFHPNCIEQWLSNNNNCPLCKKTITEQALEQQRRDRGASVRRFNNRPSR